MKCNNQNRSEPFANGNNQDRRGRFKPGNRAAVGRRHPHASTVARLRSELFNVVSTERFAQIVDTLCKKAIDDGDVQAATLILKYTLGEGTDILERIEELESTIIGGDAKR